MFSVLRGNSLTMPQAIISLCQHLELYYEDVRGFQSQWQSAYGRFLMSGLFPNTDLQIQCAPVASCFDLINKHREKTSEGFEHCRTSGNCTPSNGSVHYDTALTHRSLQIHSPPQNNSLDHIFLINQKPDPDLFMWFNRCIGR